jgi:hypothetical protein
VKEESGVVPTSLSNPHFYMLHLDLRKMNKNMLSASTSIF